MAELQASKNQLAANDLRPGSIIAERVVLLDEAAFSAFAKLTGDNHPIHYDPQYARDRGLRAPIAHGLLLVTMTALGATSVSDRLHASMVAMVGVEASFQSPVHLGDSVLIQVMVGEIEPKSKGISLVRFDIGMFSSARQPLARVQHRFLLKTKLE